MAFPVFCYRVNQENHVSFEREYLGLSQLFNIRLPGGGYKSMRVLFLTRNPAQTTLVWILVDGRLERAMVSTIQELCDQETFTEKFREHLNFA